MPAAATLTGNSLSASWWRLHTCSVLLGSCIWVGSRTTFQIERYPPAVAHSRREERFTTSVGVLDTHSVLSLGESQAATHLQRVFGTTSSMLFSILSSGAFSFRGDNACCCETRAFSRRRYTGVAPSTFLPSVRTLSSLGPSLGWSRRGDTTPSGEPLSETSSAASAVILASPP